MTRSETSLAALAVVAAVLSAILFYARPVSAAERQLVMPDFTALQSRAVESTDITLDGFLLKVASKVAERGTEHSREEDVAALRILSDIKSIRVRNYEFANDGEYSREDLDAVRSQLTGPDWMNIVQQRRRDPREDVDVWLNSDGERIYGIAVVASEPRSFTIVHIVGDVSVDKLAQLEGQFNIPKVTQN